MRIVGGKYRGKKLKEFEGTFVRPTSDRAKEAIFNIFQFDLPGCTFYDAFCGSGSIGLEAISRGAKKVVFTDNCKDSINLTLENLKSVNEKASVILSDACDFLSNCKEKFDFIFLDPPYASDSGVVVLKIISEKRLLTPEGVAIFEHKTGDNRVIDGLNLVKTKKYGIAEFDFYKLV